MVRRPIVLTVTALLWAANVHAQGHGYTPGDIENGGQLYQANCTACHGPDGDGVPTGCDPCPADNPNDADGDGVCNSADQCPGFDDADDPDGDGIPTGCDSCPLDNPDDSDGDGICESADVCPGFNDNVDPDGDDLPTGCDPCPTNPDPGCVMPPCSAAADCAATAARARYS